MFVKPNSRQTKLIYKKACKKFNAKTIYTGSWIGRLYKRIVAIPLIRKACLRANSGDPDKWLEERIVTVGKYIFINFIPGQTNDFRINWEEIKILGHELTHVIRQRKKGKLVWYTKYIKSEGLRAEEEIIATEVEIYLDAQNKYPIHSASYYAKKLSRIYDFNLKTLDSIRGIFAIKLNEYDKHGSKILENKASRYIWEELKNS